MDRSFLEGLELDKEVIDKILSEHHKELTPLKQENEKFKQEFESTKQELDKANEVLKGFDGVDVKALNSQIEEYKTSIKTMRKENEEKIKSITINNAIDSKFNSVPEKYRNLLKMQIDKTKISLGDSGVIGLEEQFSSLKEQYADLFTSEQTGLKFGLENKEQVNETVSKKQDDLMSIFNIKNS